ncbi:hypothetical protein [Helicobacter pametensis]|uniref:hypothetical protein n=1 Tax=Helicobacter pametensis TaxID=95149 RepID=UPI0004825BAF|nr:hypothetical protein [Helicobacter pametensis]
MKITLECKSLLLQDSLHHCLSQYLCNLEDCDFIVSDYLKTASKPVYFLSFKQKTLPFIPEQLIQDLQAFHHHLNHATPNPQDDELKSEIQGLLMEFADRFLQILKKYR